MKKILAVTVAVLSLAIIATSAGAQGRGRGQAKPKNEPQAAAQAPAGITVVFGDADRVRYQDYFAAHRIAPQSLPPGIAKNLARGKALPPGIAKRAVPVELVTSRPFPNVTYYIVGDQVVALRAGIVIDIMVNVFRR